MTDTLTSFHEELDTALARILIDIEVKGRVAVWNLQMMGRPIGTAPFIIEPAYRTWEEQQKLWKRYRDTMEIKHVTPGARRHGKSHALAIDPALLTWIADVSGAEYPGYAGRRLIGNEPWHFEYVAPKLPWWKRLYRKVRRWFR